MEEASGLRINRPPSDPWTSKTGRAPGLEGITGRLLLQVGGVRAGVLEVNDGQVGIDLTPNAQGSASVAVDSERTLEEVLGGKLHPVVANLQGRLTIGGDPTLAFRILFGLPAGTPWTALANRS